MMNPALLMEVIQRRSGEVTAVLVDNDATRSLIRMLPITIEMRDHLRQEKTGNLPHPCLKSGADSVLGRALGLWGRDDFVIYYRNGGVPQPGIVVLRQVGGNMTIFDRPGPVISASNGLIDRGRHTQTLFSAREMRWNY